MVRIPFYETIEEPEITYTGSMHHAEILIPSGLFRRDDLSTTRSGE